MRQLLKKNKKSCIEDKIEKNHYGNIILEEDENEKGFCDITLTCDEQQNRPFKCDECPEQFMLKRHAKSHKRTHTKIKIISCKICRKLFSSKQEFEEQLLKTSYKFFLECIKLKVLKNGGKDGRKFLPKQDQNFMFQVF